MLPPVSALGQCNLLLSACFEVNMGFSKPGGQYHPGTVVNFKSLFLYLLKTFVGGTDARQEATKIQEAGPDHEKRLLDRIPTMSVACLAIDLGLN